MVIQSKISVKELLMQTYGSSISGSDVKKTIGAFSESFIITI